MFAFVLWDAEAKVLVAGRDRFGEKPLFYAEADGELLLASEANALTRTGLVPTTVSAEALGAVSAGRPCGPTGSRRSSTQPRAASISTS